MTRLAFTRTGAGPTLVLLHYLGASRHAWDPVVPTLAARFDVIAVDLPGFGASAPLPPDVEPSPAAMAAAVGGLLDELGVGSAHLVGNSVGGWVALELAVLRPTASVTLLSPAGLWRGDTPLYCRVSLGGSRWLSEHAPHLVSRLVGTRLGRILVLGQTHGQPTRVAPEEARRTIRALGTCPGFDATLRATAKRHYAAGPVAAPVTVAFGSRDRLLLPRQSRNLGELPLDAHVGALPGMGHVPAAVDAPAVVALITAGTSRAEQQVTEGALPATTKMG